jgi:uncharacterized protein (DUF849 family)
MNKVIISCAITGSAHTPSMSDSLPITPEEITEASIQAASAGASILHLHARNPDNGEPTGKVDVYQQFLSAISDKTDAIVNITTGGAVTMSVKERLAAAECFEPEMCSLNMGSINFSFFSAARNISDWKYDWEESYVTGSDDYVFRNTFRDITYILETLSDKGTKFEFECYDVGHLYNLAYFVKEGLVKPPFFIQMVFGILGGIGAELDNVMFMKKTADRLFGENNYQWSVLAAGRHQMPFSNQSALMGGHVRVGLEDSLFIERGKLATSNAEQVNKIRKVIENMGMEIASPTEARELLQLKGLSNVKF